MQAMATASVCSGAGKPLVGEEIESSCHSQLLLSVSIVSIDDSCVNAAAGSLHSEERASLLSLSTKPTLVKMACIEPTRRH